MLSIVLGASAHLHDPGVGHPETWARVQQAVQSLAGAGYSIERCEREATRDELLRIHSQAHVDCILGLRGQEASLDVETRLGRDSVKAALNAAGTALAMAEALAAGEKRQVFALVRPPGHHAARAATSGYCVFNNVALAADRLCRQGLRVCILDWDVHHGNGTEDVFLSRSDVLFVSIHSNHLFPQDTGDARAMGDGEGRGTTVNIPLPAGGGLSAYALATTAVILPAVLRYGPDVVLASLGFDAREADPQGNMRLQTKDFAYIGAAIAAAAAGSAKGRLGMLLEGGYNPQAIGACVLSTLAGLGRSLDDWTPGEPTAEERTCVQNTARIHNLG
jgi:acetoin utilization deacetylase AcuC-like enzyme